MSQQESDLGSRPGSSAARGGLGEPSDQHLPPRTALGALGVALYAVGVVIAGFVGSCAAGLAWGAYELGPCDTETGHNTNGIVFFGVLILIAAGPAVLARWPTDALLRTRTAQNQLLIMLVLAGCAGVALSFLGDITHCWGNAD